MGAVHKARGVVLRQKGGAGLLPGLIIGARKTAARQPGGRFRAEAGGLRPIPSWRMGLNGSSSWGPPGRQIGCALGDLKAFADGVALIAADYLAILNVLPAVGVLVDDRQMGEGLRLA